MAASAATPEVSITAAAAPAARRPRKGVFTNSKILDHLGEFGQARVKQVTPSPGPKGRQTHTRAAAPSPPTITVRTVARRTIARRTVAVSDSFCEASDATRGTVTSRFSPHPSPRRPNAFTT
ncbi:hypothetical protein GCM10009733_028770 [Nonomuraea maheshkhaliensis]|uniref:Uncharacterized protein n=1 Tax=Nonomuraea maheshkhaliensis TaxID=419590 RepID=A0ABP4QZV5_9ACTN